MSNLQLWDFFQGTQERVRNSHGKRAISVRAIEVLLYTEEGERICSRVSAKFHLSGNYASFKSHSYCYPTLKYSAKCTGYMLRIQGCGTNSLTPKDNYILFVISSLSLIRPIRVIVCT